jgi:Arc/MetJ family transcription regulator
MGSIFGHIMKTTVDLDEKKLRRLMRLTGLKTRKATIDFALTEAERLAKIKKLFQEPFYLEAEGPVVDPDYDVISMRKREKPRDASR